MDEPRLLLEARRFRVVRKSYATRDGATHDREIVLHPGAVAVVPILDDGRVCLIQNYRTAVDETLIELPAGTLEPGEDPLETAHRELTEETGYRAARMDLLKSFYMSPGILQERMHLYRATGLTDGEAHLDQGEQIDRLEVPWPDAMAMAYDGRIQDAKTLIGLFFCDWASRSAASGG